LTKLKNYITLSATQDIVIDAYRIESSDKNMQSMLSATYIAGYRIGMLVAGAGGYQDQH
jgi:PAT family beta-lactamase induction signal transducer AmpG